MARDYAKLIGHLIAKGESAAELGHEEEAAAYRLKAETLMREYRISEEETIAQDQFSILPQRFEVVLMESNAYANPMQGDYIALWSEIAMHAGVRYVAEYRWKDEDYRSAEDSSIVAVVYGYEMDVRLAEFYWTAARLVFMTRIDARVNPILSDRENCYFLRNSGMSRVDIAAKLWGEDTRKNGVAHGRVQQYYLAECAARGETPRVSGRGIQVKLYREAYANAFVSEFGRRLREARNAADTKQGTITLSGRKERVDEAFYVAYPNRRPASEEELAERQAKLEEQMSQPCAACAVTKSKTGKCRRCRPTTYSEADYRRWDRRQNGPEARAGRASGAAAARAVNVDRTAGPRQSRTEAAPVRSQIG